MKVLETSSRNRLILSASEDCSLRISSLTPQKSSQYELMRLETYDGHISSVKTLEVLNLKNSDEFSRNLVFSAGGRAQLKVWEINIKNRGIIASDDVVASELTEFMMRTDRDRKNVQKQEHLYFMDPETRFMDIASYLCDVNLVILFVACSDGFIRIFCYNIELFKLTLISRISYFNRCILKVHCFLNENDVILLSMATDGFINLWNVNCIIEGVKNNEKLENGHLINEGVPFAKWRPHQSGINSYDFLDNSNEYFIASGGDDNKINISIFEIKNSSGNKVFKLKDEWASSSMHCAQITGNSII